MLNQELLEYISHELDQGTHKTAIKKALIDNGWNVDDVDQALQSFEDDWTHATDEDVQKSSSVGGGEGKEASGKLVPVVIAASVLLILLGGAVSAFYFLGYETKDVNTTDTTSGEQEEDLDNGDVEESIDSASDTRESVVHDSERDESKDENTSTEGSEDVQDNSSTLEVDSGGKISCGTITSAVDSADIESDQKFQCISDRVAEGCGETSLVITDGSDEVLLETFDQNGMCTLKITFLHVQNNLSAIEEMTGLPHKELLKPGNDPFISCSMDALYDMGVGDGGDWSVYATEDPAEFMFGTYFVLSFAYMDFGTQAVNEYSSCETGYLSMEEIESKMQ